MSLQPPGPQWQGHTRGLTGRREAAPSTRDCWQGAETSTGRDEVLGEGVEERWCHSSSSKRPRCSAALSQPPPSLTGTLLSPKTRHTHTNTPLAAWGELQHVIPPRFNSKGTPPASVLWSPRCTMALRHRGATGIVSSPPRRQIWTEQYS